MEDTVTGAQTIGRVTKPKPERAILKAGYSSFVKQYARQNKTPTLALPLSS